MVRTALSLSLTALVLLAQSGPVEGRAWIVNAQGTGDAPTIQAAVDSTSPGDSVLVEPGTYVENVVVDKSIFVGGNAGSSATTIDGTLALRADGARGSGFRLVGTDRGAYVRMGAEIVSCVFEAALGLWVRDSGSVTDCEFRNGTGIHYDPPHPGGTLTVSGCVFEDNLVTGDPEVSIIGIECNSTKCSGTVVIVLDCTFMRNTTAGAAVVGYDRMTIPGGLDLTVEGCHFLDNDGPAVGLSPWAVTVGRAEGVPDYTVLTVRGNTIARSAEYSLGDDVDGFSETSTIERNVITGGQIGLYPPNGGAGPTISCNLVWGNGTNWMGFPDPTGTNGNLSEPPKYCDSPSGDFTVAENSPLLPANNSCGVEIGAFGQGCGPLSSDAASWGRIKGMYR